MSPREKAPVLRAYRRILWPTDFSPLATAALPHALKLAADNGAELVVLHVLPVAALFAMAEMMGAAWEQLDRANWTRAKAELLRITEQLQRKAPPLRVHRVVAKGVAFDQILRVAKRLRCDLIVLATHGRTGLRHVVLGSVAENVVRRAPCPVLTVRPPRFSL
ncbi:MAG TPA: universal stress protein [bacterium]|nr:universal stress protein [bacterium]